jgi:hypothetical protein
MDEERFQQMEKRLNEQVSGDTGGSADASEYPRERLE